MGPEIVETHDQFCAEHRGAVPNFKTYNATLSHPDKYQAIYKRNCINIPKVIERTLLVSALVGTGYVLSAGAAAYNASQLGLLSRLGLIPAQPAIPGLAVVGAQAVSASTLTGSYNATMGSIYLGELGNFSIKKIRAGSYPAVITINGFLNEGNTNQTEWIRALENKYRNNVWYHLDWESGSFLSMLNLPTVTLTWQKAQKSADKAGFVLADILSRCIRKDFILMGHSLGCRVIHQTLHNLALKSDQIVDVHLFGGAVDNEASTWREAAAHVSGRIHNYYSANDDVLSKLYKLVSQILSTTPVSTPDSFGRCRV